MIRRTQIYLDDRQRRKLDQVAKRTRRTVSELIREAIDARYAATPKSDFLDALRAGAFGIWRQRSDLGPTDTYIRRLRRGNELAGDRPRRYRRSHGLELGDAMIGASVLQHGERLATFNRRRYPGVTQLASPDR